MKRVLPIAVILAFFALSAGLVFAGMSKKEWKKTKTALAKQLAAYKEANAAENEAMRNLASAQTLPLSMRKDKVKVLPNPILRISEGYISNKKQPGAPLWGGADGCKCHFGRVLFTHRC